MLELRPYQLTLYNKTRAEFGKGRRRVLVVAPCGAGKTAIAAAMMRDTLKAHPEGECVMLVHRRELLTQHLETFAGYGLDTSRIRVEMVMTEARRLEKHSKPLLLVVDEAHLACAVTWQRVIDRYDTFTVGFSATPSRLDNRPLGDIFHCMVEGVTHKELEAQNRLAPFDYYAPVQLDLTGVRKQRGDFVTEDLTDLVMNRTIYGNVLQSYRKFAPDRRAIAFCINVQHSRETAELFNSAGIPAASLDGTMRKSTRDKIMRDFRAGTLRVLTSCNIISEGISVDECDCCLLLRPTDSLALYIQQSCRCLRYMPGKRAVILDFCGNYTRHGLPDSNRDWNLYSNTKSIREYNPDGTLCLRVCSFCFKTFQTAPVCPFCGEGYELTPRELKRMEEIELKRIEAEKFEAEQTRKRNAAQDIRNARSFDDLLAIEKKYGYAKGWAHIRARVRGYKTH